MSLKGSNYWNNFYKKNLTDRPSSFSRFILKKFKSKKFIFYDLGCGNGRDTIYFNRKKIKCYGIDNSSTAINKNKKKNQEYNNNFFKKNFCTLFNNIKINKNFVIYSRFTLHAVGYNCEKILLNSLKKQKKLKYIFIETRSTKDDFFGIGKKIGRNEYFTNHSNHYRRFIDPKEIKKKLEKFSKIIFFKVGKNLAKFKNENPCVLRIIAKVN